jgi:hypothetical protein
MKRLPKIKLLRNRFFRNSPAGFEFYAVSGQNRDHKGKANSWCNNAIIELGVQAR